MKPIYWLMALSLALPLSAARADDAPAGDAAASADAGAGAGAGGSKPNIIYRKKTSVSFDDAVVESNTDNPEGVYVVTPPSQSFGNLLKLRPNFHRELMRDSLLLK